MREPPISDNALLPDCSSAQEGARVGAPSSARWSWLVNAAWALAPEFLRIRITIPIECPLTG